MEEVHAVSQEGHRWRCGRLRDRHQWLSPERLSRSRGISQMPFGVETVFPVGPLAYRVDGTMGKIRDGRISERFHIVNANNAHIPTTPFVDPRYSGVNALIG